MNRAQLSRSLSSLGPPALVFAAVAGGVLLLMLGLEAWVLSPTSTTARERAASLLPTIPDDASPMFIFEGEGETVAYALGAVGLFDLSGDIQGTFTLDELRSTSYSEESATVGLSLRNSETFDSVVLRARIPANLNTPSDPLRLSFTFDSTTFFPKQGACTVTFEELEPHEDPRLGYMAPTLSASVSCAGVRSLRREATISVEGALRITPFQVEPPEGR